MISPHAPADYWPYAGITKDVYLEGTDKITVSKILTNAKDHSLDMYAVIYNTDESGTGNYCGILIQEAVPVGAENKKKKKIL